MSEQKANLLQTLKAIDDLMDKYLSESSVEKAVSLCYIVEHGFDDARQRIVLKFGSLKPYIEVLEALQRAGISSIPEDAKGLVSAKKIILRQLLIKDALSVIDKLDPLVKDVVAVILLVFENVGELPSNTEDIFRLYQTLTGKTLPTAVKGELYRYLHQLHILDLRYGSYYFSSDAPYILRALKDRVPKIIIEFKSEQEKK
ncbi:MAG: hypothetical protein LM564_00285 [Desulfurococcaceae archaeon]|nr:hypothetical protein [Desulfurococcaceae archaeon]